MADTPLRALVADDEEPARAELVYLLSQDPRIGHIQTASDGPEALKILQASDLDVVFCDIKMPGLDGIDLASVLSKFRPRARGSSSSRRTTNTPSQPSSSTRPTTS